MTPYIMEKARELADKIYPRYEFGAYAIIGKEPATEIIAAALAEARAVPDGWKLVPKVATREMITAWETAWQESLGSCYYAYKAMIAAAPNPPIAGDGQ